MNNIIIISTICIVAYVIISIINIFMSQFEFKYNPWLYIDLYIGRKNFYNFYKKNKTTIDNLIKLEVDLKGGKNV